MKANHKVKLTNIPVLYLKEGEIFVCYSPSLDLAAHGDSFEDAYESFGMTLKLFCEEVTKVGTWGKVLTDCGWVKQNKTLVPPRMIGMDTESFHIPAHA